VNEARRVFRRRHRLSRARDFQATYKQGLRKQRGPLLVFARPNGLGHARLGLSVSRRVGNAVTRNAIKRRVREAFRLLMADRPGDHDLIVVVRRHEALPTDEYRRLLASAWAALDRAWRKRGERQESPRDDDPRQPTPGRAP
jgi:ribonuclease P protein component